MNDSMALWSRPALAAQVLRRRRDGRAELLLRITGIEQPRQLLRLERVLQALPGLLRMSIDRAAQRLRVVIDDQTLPLPQLLAACAEVGCAAQPLHRERLDDPGRALAEASLKRLLVAGVFAMQAMMFALVLYVGAFDPLDATTAQLFRWLGLLSAAPVVGYAAWPFYHAALAGLRAGKPGIDVPVALAIICIFGASVVNAVAGAGEVYFDSVSMFVFVLMLGRHIHLRAQLRHRAFGDAMADAMPLTASRRGADGKLETVAAAELRLGDCVQVAEGEAAPCDGVLESAHARIDASLLTGESRAVAQSRGDAISAGSIALGAPLELRITRELAASATSVLARLAANAQAGPTALRDADARPAQRFVRRVLVLALATAAFWLWRDPARAFDATLAVLVVACPCAFALAAPAALARAMTVLARAGVLVLRPAALLAMARVDRVLFDKTGTLTAPVVRMDAIEALRGISRDAAWTLAAQLAQSSRHPLARAVAEHMPAVAAGRLDAIELVPGAGLRARLGVRALRLGHAGFAGAPSLDDDALWLADADGPLARMPVTDSLRAGAAATVTALRQAGLAPILLSGDAASRTASVATELGIDDWAARQSPQDKWARVRREQAAGKVVLAVGDGGNDAAALAAADVSAVPLEATDLARSHAGLALLHGIDNLPGVRALALRVQTITRQNRRWSLAWNLGAVPFAAFGLISPWLAAIGMSVSSVAVVLNSLRIAAPADPAPGETSARSAGP